MSPPNHISRPEQSWLARLAQVSPRSFAVPATAKKSQAAAVDRRLACCPSALAVTAHHVAFHGFLLDYELTHQRAALQVVLGGLVVCESRLVAVQLVEIDAVR